MMKNKNLNLQLKVKLHFLKFEKFSHLIYEKFIEIILLTGINELGIN